MLLQVQNADGAWTDVIAPRGTVTVLAGYTLERATCGLIKASNHRVVRSNISGTAVAHACSLHFLRTRHTFSQHGLQFMTSVSAFLPAIGRPCNIGRTRGSCLFEDTRVCIAYVPDSLVLHFILCRY